MNTPAAIPLILALAAGASLSACAGSAQSPAQPGAASAVSTAPASPAAETSGFAKATATATAASSARLTMVVHKSPSCGCCALWVDHLREAGFEVEVRNHDNLNPVKERVGVPLGKGSCHTAEIGGYFVEGHVPAADIKRLLAQKPDARGLVLPGMPAGSPGMELPDGTTQPYTVELVGSDGTITAFAQHGR